MKLSNDDICSIYAATMKAALDPCQISKIAVLKRAEIKVHHPKSWITFNCTTKKIVYCLDLFFFGGGGLEYWYFYVLESIFGLHR